MKKNFLKPTAAFLAAAMAFSGLSFSSFAAEKDYPAADIVTVSATANNNIYDVTEPAVQESTAATEATKPVTADYPEITGFTNIANGTKISWKKYAGAAKYRVYVISGTEQKYLGESTTLSYTHTGLKNGTSLRYTVRALNSSNAFIGDCNAQGYLNTFYAPPVIGSIENVYGGIKLKWNKCGSSVSYSIYRKTKNSGWKHIGNSSSASYTDKSVSAGTKYTYTVRCTDNSGKLVSSYNKGKSRTYVKAPIINKFKNTNTGSTISWSKCVGAKKYKVYYLDSNKKWKVLGTTASTSFSHNKLKSGKKYTYTVRCLDKKGSLISGYDNKGKTNLFLAPPAISSVSKAKKGTLVKWKSVSGVAGYRLYRKTMGSSWSKLADITSGSSYTDTSAKKGKVYSYTLRYLGKSKKPISSYISNTKYYRNGSLANGLVTVNKSKYYLKNGVIQKKGIVGSDKYGWYYAGKNGKIDTSYRNAVTQHGKDWVVMDGKATKVTSKSDRTLFRAMKIVTKITNKKMSKSQKLKTCYNYVKNAYTELNPRIPHYHGSDWPIIYANDMFVDGAGNCFSYGAAFAYMAKAIGYKNVYCCNSGGHGWAEVDGLIYDPEWSRHHTKEYYALNYNTTKDPNYKAAIAPGLSWMHVKI